MGTEIPPRPGARRAEHHGCGLLRCPRRRRCGIAHVTTRHEQGAGYSADTSARALATSGPTVTAVPEETAR